MAALDHWVTREIVDRAAITADEAVETIEWLEAVAAAIQKTVGKTAPAPDYDNAPEEAGRLGKAPEPTAVQREVLTRRRSRWDETSLRESIERYCSGILNTESRSRPER